MTDTTFTTATVTTTKWAHSVNIAGRTRRRESVLRMPTLGELLQLKLKERRHLPLPMAAGAGELHGLRGYRGWARACSPCLLRWRLPVVDHSLGWNADQAPRESGWRVLYVDGEMNMSDIQGARCGPFWGPLRASTGTVPEQTFPSSLGSSSAPRRASP